MYFTTLTEWLDHFSAIHPQEMDFSLERITRVARKLNLIPFSSFVITVAGTNGKGSCVALTESILRAQGFQTGAYFSPHLLHYNERIQINGKMIDDESLCKAFAKIENAREEISLTYFEAGTLAALLLFKEANIDVAILEVGLGGRLDAVNIIDADIAMISTIALDHLEILGDNREAIGFEKAGIMRSGKPCVCGDFSEPLSIRRYANQVGAQLYSHDKDFRYFIRHDSQQFWDWKSSQQTLENLPLPSLELQNAATVLKVIECLPPKFSVSREALEKGLQQVSLAGRFQFIERKGIQHIVDVAHNPAGGLLLAKKLQSLPRKGKNHAVIAMLRDKDRMATVAPLLEPIDAWYVAGLEVSRGESAHALTQILQKTTNKSVTPFDTVKEAYECAFANAKKDDSIIIFGSFHTVAEAMQEFLANKKFSSLGDLER